MFGVGRLLIGVFVLLCGWVKDVAARRAAEAPAVSRRGRG